MDKLTLLFDFDGTLADSIHLGLNIANKIAPEFGIEPLTEKQFEEVRSMSIPKALKYLKIPFYKVPKAIALALVEYRHRIHELEPYPGIDTMLCDLRKLGCELALISSNTSENVSYFIEHHSLHYFNWIEGTSGILKKHSSIRKQMKKHKLTKENVIYVGDEIRDVIAAKKCGIRVISVTWGFHTQELLSSKDPDYLVDNPSQITNIVQKLLSK
nr:phosphoglycolate phosphatase [Candidatus Cloacimonadota bacterium]